MTADSSGPPSPPPDPSWPVTLLGSLPLPALPGEGLPVCPLPPAPHPADESGLPLSFLLPPARPGDLGRLGHYHVLRLLGKGGMAYVFLAEDADLHRRVALKVMKPDLALDPSCGDRFLREARLLASLAHDNLVTVYQVGQQGHAFYFAMELLRGETLEDRLARLGRVSVADVVELGGQVCAGLAFIHAQGLVHRDIKPSNLWVEAPGERVKILDLGLARPSEDGTDLTRTGMLLGTPCFMAPEQARGERVDARADLFSLGCVLYSLATGARPFDAPGTMAVLTALAVRDPVPPHRLNPDLPAELSHLIVRLLEKDPEDRPGSAAEVLETLQQIAADLDNAPGRSRLGSRTLLAVPPAARRLRPASRPRRRAASKRSAVLLSAATALVLLALASLTAWLLMPPPTGQAGTSIPGAAAGPPAAAPVKVFVLAGQSNMAGRARTATLDWLGEDPRHRWLLRKLKTPEGGWAVRNDVWIHFSRENGVKKGPLTVGFGEHDDEIGPELAFGHAVADHFKDPVVLIKVTLGGLGLAAEGRPPSSGGQCGPFYRRMIWTVKEVLADLPAHFPATARRGYELAGFVWFQGWNDLIFAERRAEYEFNLVNLVRDVRRDLGVPGLPVVIGEEGVHGNKPSEEVASLRRAQEAAARRAEFKGNVAFVRTVPFWDEEASALFDKGFVNGKWVDREAQARFEKMGSQLPFHYLGSGKILSLIGNAFGEAACEMCRR